MRSPLYIYVAIFLLLTVKTLAQEKKEYDIGFVLDKKTTEVEQLIEELQYEIIAVVGEDAKVNFSEKDRLVNNFNVELARENYEALLVSDVDIIIAFGSINNGVISKYKTYKKPTILFGALSAELMEGVPEFIDVENFTTILTTQSFTKDLKTLKDISNAKNVGVLVEEGFLNSRPLTNTFGRIAKELNIQVTVVPFDSLSDILTSIDGFDGIYLAGGFYLSDAEIRELADVLIKRKLPSISGDTIKDVEMGILASNRDNAEMNQYFRRIALTVETIINNEDLSDLSIKLDVKPNLTINYTTAEKIGLPLKYSLIATTNLLGNPTERSAGKKYNLIEVMQEAIAENLELQTYRQDVQLSQEDVRIAKSDYLPNVSVGASGNYVDPELAVASNGQNPEILTNTNATLTQTVFSEAANANISIQKSLQKAQQENYNSEELNTVFSASTAYFNALILKANVSIQSQNLDLTKYNLKVATENFEAGQAGKADVLRFRSELAQNMQSLIESRNQLDQAYYELNQVLNNPIDSKIDVEEAELQEGVYKNYNYEQLGNFIDDPTLKKPFVDFLVEEAISNAPELKSLNYNLEAAERSEKLYGPGRFLPTLALQGQYYYEISRSGEGTEFPPVFMAPPRDYYTVGLSLKLPIFDQNRQNINKEIASIQKDQINVFQDNVRLTVEKNINDAVLQLVNQIANIELSKLSEETAKEALDLTQTSYSNGAVNIVQLLDAQNNYLQAQLARTNATYNYLLSSMQLERYLGNFFLLQTEAERQEFINRFLEYTSNN